MKSRKQENISVILINLLILQERRRQLKGWDKYNRVGGRIHRIMIILRAPSRKAKVPEKSEQLERELKNLHTSLKGILEGQENNCRSATIIAQSILRYL